MTATTNITNKHKMPKYKPKKPSLIDFSKKYANNDEACEKCFFDIKYPDGYICPECGCKHYRKVPGKKYCYACKDCGHQSYLFAGTIFQDNKLDLYKLLLGLYLFFTSNKGISAMEIRSQLDVNYKTALLLCRKCRILMRDSNAKHVLDSCFYEADVAYIGSKSKQPGHQGRGTEKQAFFAALSTAQENAYPECVKLTTVAKDNSAVTEQFLLNSITVGEYRVLNTDGNTTFNILKTNMTVFNEKVDYGLKNHRLYWLNIVISNVKNNITGIYKGISKRDLPLFMSEQEYRFNHRKSGTTLMNNVFRYIGLSKPMPKRAIIAEIDEAYCLACA